MCFHLGDFSIENDRGSNVTPSYKQPSTEKRIDFYWSHSHLPYSSTQLKGETSFIVLNFFFFIILFVCKTFQEYSLKIPSRLLPYLGVHVILDRRLHIVLLFAQIYKRVFSQNTFFNFVYEIEKAVLN